jgi:hypothetical protein
LVMLSAKESGQERSNGASYNGQGDTAKPSHAVKGSTHDDMDDAIPF